MLVTYIFLQKLKTTLIPLFTIPVSLIATFIVVYLLGFNINILTLFAMILAIGLVVDDAIIVVERVQYLILNEKRDAKTASIIAMQQIGSAIVATTFVLLAIFIPVGLMAGITGKIYQQFAVTIATAVTFSAVNALTLSPALCAIFLRGDENSQPHGFFAWFDKMLDKSKGHYLKAVVYFSEHLKIMLLCMLGTMGLIALGFVYTPTSFLPEEDQGIIFANIQLADTSSINETNKVLGEMNDKILQAKGVKYFISVAGYSMLGGSGENVALGVIGLDNWDERKSKNLSIEAISSDLRRQFSGNKQAVINFFAPPAIPGVGQSNGISWDFVTMNGNTSPQKLYEQLQKYLRAINKSGYFDYAFTTFTAQTPHIYLDIDRKKAEYYKIPVSSLFTTLQNNLGSRYINNITLSGQVNKVILQADYQYRRQPEDIGNLYARSSDGNLVRINSFAEVKNELSPKIIYRFNQYTAASVTAQSKVGVSSGTALK